MSTPIDDGGSAFPVPPERLNSANGDNHWAYASQGMSLRDWFASKASEEDLQGFLPQTVGEVSFLFSKDGIHRTRQWARYQHADAMLAARKNHVQPTHSSLTPALPQSY